MQPNPDQQPYPPQPSGQPAPVQPYPPQQYPPPGYSQPGYPPQQAGYPPQQAGYPPQQQPYPQSQPYPPQQMPVAPQPSYPYPYPPQAYPPQMQPPPRNSGNANGLIIGVSVGVVGLLLIAFVTFFLLYTRSGHGTTISGTTTGQQLTQTVSNTWTITISNAHTTKGDAITSSALKPGDTYLVMNIATQNISSQQQYFYGFIDFQVKNPSGTDYSTTYFPGPEPPDGNIDAGASKSGALAFEVPAGQHTFTLIYNDDLLAANAQWTLSV